MSSFHVLQLSLTPADERVAVVCLWGNSAVILRVPQRILKSGRAQVEPQCTLQPYSACADKEVPTCTALLVGLGVNKTPVTAGGWT